MKLLLNALEYIQRFLKIIDKKGAIIPFVLNEPQQRLYSVIREQWNQGKPVRVIILKARQMGFSTLVEAIIFWMAATAFNVRCMIVAHTDDATGNLFQMSKRYLEYLPDQLKPMQQASNAQEIVFDRPARYKGSAKGLGSRIRCATAGGQGIGRSFTLKALHLSEFAFWPGDKHATITGLLQAVPDEPGTFVAIESTAKGYDEFKNLWDKAVADQQAGKEGFIPVFFAWHEMREYRRSVPANFCRTEEEEQLAQTFDLDDEQLAWRRWAIDNLCGGDIEMFHQEYPSTPDEAFISTGRCVFDKNTLVLRRKQVQELAWEHGQFRLEYDIAGGIGKFQWEQDNRGYIRILEQPQPGVPYVIGADTAGTGSDFFAAHVLDNRTGKQVAVLHQQFGERAFAEQIYCLGMYYNEALIGVEVNYSTFPQLMLEQLGYTNFYEREKYDTYTGDNKKAYGFETTTKSRPVIIDGLKDVAKQALETITDFATMGEMLTFVYNEHFRPQAENGEHDDLVMALAIAHGIRGQQETAADIIDETLKTLWTEDMWEDFNKASPEIQKLLIQQWGEPK